MKLEMGLSLGHRIEHGHRLSLEIRHKLEQEVLALRLELVGLIRGVIYRPQAICPECRRSMMPLEILQGFRIDPNDFTTACSGCGHRFEPKLVFTEDASSGTIPYYCPSQVLPMLVGKDGLPPEELRRLHPAVYHSTVVHHGSLRRGFRQAGLTYPHDEVTDWATKIVGFLGKLPDTEIAKAVDQPVKRIGRLRRQKGIAPYSKRRAAEDLD